MGNTLLGVICGVGEEPRINAAFNPISTSDDHAILERVHECIIKEKIPHGVDQFTTTMRQDVLLLCVPLFMERSRKVAKVVRKLQQGMSLVSPKFIKSHTDGMYATW
jgi:hypothetical protein